MTREYRFTAILSEKGVQPPVLREFVFQATGYLEARQKLSDLIEEAKASL